jgi:hypothetical protein
MIITSHKFLESLDDSQFLKAVSLCGNSVALDSFIEEMKLSGKPGLKEFYFPAEEVTA